jgi:hypothetical protein
MKVNQGGWHLRQSTSLANDVTANAAQCNPSPIPQLLKRVTLGAGSRISSMVEKALPVAKSFDRLVSKPDYIVVRSEEEVRWLFYYLVSYPG